MTEHSGRRHATLISTVLAILAGILVACGQSAAPPATRPAQRHLITNRSHQLAFYVTPGKLPAIVLDSGGGLDASYWKNLVPTVAASTGSEIITYDRAGLGASDEVPGPWQPDRTHSGGATRRPRSLRQRPTAHLSVQRAAHTTFLSIVPMSSSMRQRA
jgi:pimeloyl-ACP methyl ester carboxylesterase